VESPPTPERSSPPLPPAAYAPAREGRSVSFYVAIFLALLLLVSGALNLLLLFFSVVGSAASPFGVGSVAEDGAMYELVAVGGDRRARQMILRIPVAGAISENPSPLIGGAGGTVSQVRRALATAARNDDVKAVLLDINSPGGGVTDSDEIWSAITAFRREHGKKVLALLGDTAASGGYYIAAACDRIVARPTTITGSIGVIVGSYEYAEGLKKLGIKPVTLISPDTPYKDILSGERTMTDDERQKLLAIVQEMYERFVDVVDSGRANLDRDEVRKLANGLIYSAQQALRTGLVDGIGSSQEALAMLREMAGLDAEAKVVEQRRVPTFLDALVGGPRLSFDRELAGLLRASTGARFLYYWQGGR
jgi:protease-4